MSNLAVIKQPSIMATMAAKFNVEDNGCWNWLGATSRGYGQLTYKGSHTTAHRFFFELYKGAIEKGLWVLHKCDNKLCVNPDHLYEGSAIDNRADMLNRKRWAHPYSKRTECFRGHVYEEEGFSINKSDGSRVCKTCQRDHKRKQRLLKGAIQ